MEQFPHINITVPVFNRTSETLKTLLSLKKYTAARYTLNVVDNGSDADCADVLTALYEDGIIDNLFRLDKNYGVSCACNVGFALSKADIYIKFDNDIEVLKRDWLSSAFSIWKHGEFPSVFGHYQTNQPVGSAKPVEKNTSDGLLYEKVQVIPGFVFMIPHFVLQHVGFFCEDYGLYGDEDTDYCLRLQVAGIPIYATDMKQFVVEQPYNNVYTSRKINKHAQVRINRGNSKKVGVFACNKILYDFCLKQINVPRKYCIECCDGINVTVCENEQYKDYWKKFLHCKVAITQHINRTGILDFDELLIYLKEVMRGYN